MAKVITKPVRGSNPRPPAQQSGAPPTDLIWRSTILARIQPNCKLLNVFYRKNIAKLNKELQTKTLLQLSETDRLRHTEHQLHISESKVEKLNSENIKLRLKIEDLRIKMQSRKYHIKKILRNLVLPLTSHSASHLRARPKRYLVGFPFSFCFTSFTSLSIHKTKLTLSRDSLQCKDVKVLNFRRCYTLKN